MKLGTKIVLGFVLTNLIFLVLVVAVFTFMRPVQIGAIRLNENILPLLDQSVAIRYNSIYENFQMRTYMLNRSEAAWEAATQSSDVILKTFDAVEALLNQPGSEAIRTPDVLSAFQTLRTDYGKYSELAHQVKGRQETILKNRADLMGGHAEFTKALNELLTAQTATEEQEIFGNTDPNLIMRRIKRVSDLKTVKNYVDEVVLYAQQATADGRPELFDEARKSIQKAQELLGKLNEDNRTEATRAAMANLINLLGVADGLVDHAGKQPFAFPALTG